MFLEKWFTTHIWCDHTYFDFNLVKEDCKLIASNLKGRKRSNIGGWQSMDIDFSEYKEFEGLQVVRDILNQKIEEFANDLNLPPEQKLKINTLWINLNDKDHYNVRHSHPCSVFSGVLYVYTNENTGDIVFYNNNINTNYDFHSIESYPNYHSVSYTPENGKIIIFPSWAQHQVMPNKSHETRISISFNIEVETVIEDSNN